MSITQQQFFALLRSGLWNIPIDTAMFSGEVDWERILTIAKMQTTTGVVFDGIAKLPAEMQLPATLMRSLYQTVIRIDQSHQLLNSRLTEIVPLLQSEGIRPILFKGQGVAQNYPNPVRRQCGDIDLYIGKKDYDKACKLVQDKGIVSGGGSESFKHYHFDWEGVTIEFHLIAERLNDPFCNKRFQAWTAYHLHGEGLRKWNLDNTEIPLPAVNFDALYIFNHLYLHFIAGGIGLRQLCDWALYLHAFGSQLDKEKLYKDLKSFGLLRAWQIFGYIAVHHLGLPEKEFPFYTKDYKEHAQKVLDKILETGNFGHYNPEHKKRPSGFLSGKLHSLLLEQKWLIGIFSLFPKDAFLFYFIFWANGIRNIIRGR